MEESEGREAVPDDVYHMPSLPFVIEEDRPNPH